MNLLSPETVIMALYDYLCDWRYNQFQFPNDPSLGIYFKLEICVDNYGYEKDGSTHHEDWEAHYRRILHVIILTHHRVYVAVNQDSLTVPSPDLFKNMSNHDSCYRSALSDISKLWQEGYHQCWDHTPSEHQRVPVSAGINATLTPQLTRPFKFVRVERGNYIDNYHDVLTSIKEVKARIVVE